MKKIGESKLPVLPYESTLANSFKLVGGVDIAIEFARLAAEKNDQVAKVVYDWDQLSVTERRKVPIEALCKGAGLDPADFLGEVTASAFRHNMDMSKFMTAVYQPKVTEATILTALDREHKDSFRSQELLHKSSGLLPTPQGARIAIQNVNRQENASGLPSYEDDIIEFTEATR